MTIRAVSGGYLSVLFASALSVLHAGCVTSDSEDPAASSALAPAASLALPSFQGNPQIPEAYGGELVVSYFTVAMDDTTVRSMLPPGVELRPQPLTLPGKHPVIFVHNHFVRMEAPGGAAVSVRRVVHLDSGTADQE
jgi:hypothetical protein